jgi:peptide/nickel transport system substrate-binding protein
MARLLGSGIACRQCTADVPGAARAGMPRRVLHHRRRRGLLGANPSVEEAAMRLVRSLVLTLVVIAQVVTAPVPAAAAPEGTMTWGVHITLASRWLDPAETEGIITPFMVLYALHDALVKPMPAGINTPSLAESFTQSKDGLTYEFVLRKGVKFHHGEPVTAADVKFSFERYKGSGARLLKERVREVQIVDSGRVRFLLKEPWPDFMTFYGTSATGAGWVVPKAYVEKVGDDGFKRAPIGAGPYKFVSFNPGVELVMEAWEGYWRKVPHIKRLVYRSLPEETTRAAALKKGEVDIAYLLTGPVAQDIQRTPGFKLVAPKESTGTFWLDLPEQWDSKSPWHDRRVRQAASLGIDRNALNQAETLGFSKPTGSLIPRALEFSRFFEPDPYDPARAKKLLAEAGYASGFDAGDFYPWPPYFSMGEALASYLQNVGIRTRIRTMERAAMTTAWREGKLKGVIVGITGAGGNAATRVEAYVSKGGIYTSGVMPDVEDLFHRQARETDVKKREALIHQIQQILHERVTHIPIYELAFIWGVGPTVEEPGINLIRGYAYSAPYEELKVKK